MRKSLKSVLAAALCGATVFAAPPAEVLAGPMTVASPLSVGLTDPAEKVYYRRHYGPRRYYGGHYRRRYGGYYRRGYGGYYRRGYGGYYRGGYYRNYGYDPSGAIFAGAALGLLGAGIAGASGYGYGYGYPGYGYGYGYPGYGYGGGW
ncbi:hypothetical protein QEV83_05785 [Methylocapsa sp. D3K7]|uniref:hypothetical protein n=1 Tax=Methylocapsa sp. D3K7 TaxID=3041435 RepID=UPI00244EC1D4|nr:hypothetical protein [Methylocapsa sp. D3K7]WGJ15769.1 hypothetical protein QEV83_05785 [Methylocapsa sp. D3K7]